MQLMLDIGKSNTKDTIRGVKEARKLIFDNIEEAYNNGNNLEAGGNMLKGSYLAARAFTHAYVVMFTVIAHILVGLYGTPMNWLMQLFYLMFSIAMYMQLILSLQSSYIS